MSKWLEYEDVFYNLDKIRCVRVEEASRFRIVFEYDSEECEHFYFDSESQARNYFDEIRIKLGL